MARCPSLWVFVFLLSIIYPASARERVYIISYVAHPRIETFYNDIVKEAYERLGLRVQFMEVSGERGLMLLNEGLVDASSVRVHRAVKHFENVIALDPPVGKAYTNLYCSARVVCDASILTDSTETVVTTRRMISAIKEARSDIPVKALMLKVEDFNRVIQLMVKGRYDYAILPSDGHPIPVFSKQKITHVTLIADNAVHSLHKQHSALADAISASIQQVLKERQTPL
ncbi:hypothetical protein [Alteromonas sp. C1M14]|uniref:hypothetical protein n=1 Tax=Alteromonas sp. C1M14 TaxID=2841567 RepID=UPI001C097248|nr:hypothetical protein [Alteromonas sp. C1M14]MBU2978252.1 hypothetical protein [Alteromonas sp. C1M14]